MPFDSRAHLADYETAIRIHHATKGVVGDVIVLVRKAAILALQEGAERITLDHLAKAYEEHWEVAVNARKERRWQHPFQTNVCKYWRRVSLRCSRSLS